ncbi:hypothetical protein EJB05_22883, partial [Eragrostis curvula]
MEWVRGTDQQNMIASVLGMGGIGKTALVSHVYSIVKYDFNTFAWIMVSQRFDVDHLLQQIVREFRKNDRRKEFPEDIDMTDCSILQDIIRNYLKNRRIFEVARLAPESNIIYLEPLEKNDAQLLFYKEAFWRNNDMICSQDKEQWAKTFVQKCNGLPIAIVCIGRLLSFRTPCSLEWEKVYKDIEMQLTNNPIIDMNIILKVSLEDLRHNIRNCFMYCCLFPEKHVMQRKSLVCLWVAEGFVEEVGNRTLEEVAEDYLTELIPAIVVKRNDSGCVLEVQMHDILRVLGLSKARDENFGSILNPAKAYLIKGARRVSTECGDLAQLVEYAPHLRSLLVFQNSFTFGSLLQLSGYQIRPVFELFNLRFLGLRRTRISSLPRSIGRLKNLLVLDAWKCKITKLPQEVTKLYKLTHLIVTAKPVTSSLECFIS